MASVRLAEGGLFGRAGQFVDARDGLVEAERLDVLTDGMDGLVDLAIQRLVPALRTRVDLGEQAPQALDEAGAALDARFRPRQVALGRAVGQHEPADRVGAIAGDDVVGVHHVLLGLRHLDHAADLDRLAIGLERGAFAGALDVARRIPDRLAIGRIDARIGLVRDHPLREQAAERLLHIDLADAGKGAGQNRA
jgi:hypothetical protein